jgi:hypothetical protein
MKPGLSAGARPRRPRRPLACPEGAIGRPPGARQRQPNEGNPSMKSSFLVRALVVIGLLGTPVVLTACSGETAGEYVDDSVISNTVRAKLLDDPDLNIFQVDVTTLRGEVQISGFVESQADKDRATQVARSVDGVRRVHNNLVIQ